MEDALAKLRDLAVSDSGFVFDPYSGATFSVNASGQVILTSLKEGLDRDGIIARLREGFDIADADLTRDIDDFVDMVRTSGLLNPEFTL